MVSLALGWLWHIWGTGTLLSEKQAMTHSSFEGQFFDVLYVPNRQELASPTGQPVFIQAACSIRTFPSTNGAVWRRTLCSWPRFQPLFHAGKSRGLSVAAARFSLITAGFSLKGVPDGQTAHGIKKYTLLSRCWHTGISWSSITLDCHTPLWCQHTHSGYGRLLPKECQ